MGIIWADWLSWMYSGVDNSLAGNGGAECAAFIPSYQKVIETLLMVSIGIFEMYITYPHLTVLPMPGSYSQRSNRTSKRVLLVVLCVTFGVELGFKFATRQMIWILNPCHIVTVLQIFILVAPPSRLVRTIFRLQIHLLSGATIALIFPVINTRLCTQALISAFAGTREIHEVRRAIVLLIRRKLPFEKEVYYLQHGLMLVIPIYLMSTGGVYTVESLTNFHWVLFSLGLMVVYHFVILQGLAVLSLVNLNSILCPAVSDPFYGPFYRVYASIHQTALILIHGKIYTIIVLVAIRLVAPHVPLEINGNASASLKKTD